MLYQHAGLSFMVTFVVTGGRSWSFQTLKFEVFKMKQEKFICLYLCNFVYWYCSNLCISWPNYVL